MGKSIFVDLTRCTGCRGCQVACKQWKDLPAEETRNRGSHQNPPDLSDKTIRLVRFSEIKETGKLEWIFFPEQCRHCFMPPCKDTADMSLEGGIMHDEATGAVYLTEAAKKFAASDVKDIRESCPYDIPRAAKDGTGVYKCDFCFDRITNNMMPACVLACPTGCMNYGEEEEMSALAAKRLEEVKPRFPNAYLEDPDSVRVIYLFQTPRDNYYQERVGKKK
jgi:formate dehydrogenase iron-sulfur subunit